ncbi:Acetoin:2,6-dichlorophenolindophenol oxidoreductase subunit alpha [Propionicimonas sp. T2.31MG-18]|uniref:thiamine pyrophosphate-dependent dehydrogenase E1 component subunit alpha n=1 Tax=Propionicimonas sp. T2.31MG-18 TaxID=3157620 RepID=UPI0035F0DDE3
MTVASETTRATAVLTDMWRIRLFEEAVEDLYGRGMMHGTMHLSIGQEAVPVGASLCLEDGDVITCTHRGHGHTIARGADLGRMMAELLGRENGYCKGRGGSMHIADVATGNLGANGIVAGGLPIAAGAALSQKMRGTDRVTLCVHGDGAVGEGAWHEAMVLASMWDLPVVFLCENNQYGMSLPSLAAYRVEKLSDKAAGYGMPGETVDGNDVDAVAAAVGRAVERARAGQGPSFVDAVTYRWRGHSKSDKNLYRSKDEIAEWRDKDPIARYSGQVIEAGVLTAADLDAIQAAVRQEIRDAVVFGTRGAEPTVESMLAGVYAPVDEQGAEARA